MMEPDGPPWALVVEDDPVIRTVHVRLLAKWGWAVESCATAALALEYLGRRLYHLVIVDGYLPDLHGSTVINAARHGNASPQGFIVAVSTDDRATNQERMLAAGADKFLCKPVQLSELEAIARSIRLT